VLELEGVTVTGQATTVDKRNASTAIATVSAEELTKVPAKSIEGNLAGKVVGATIFENSGVPGGGMQVRSAARRRFSVRAIRSTSSTA
jgi:hypothetical protein